MTRYKVGRTRPTPIWTRTTTLRLPPVGYHMWLKLVLPSLCRDVNPVFIRVFLARFVRWSNPYAAKIEWRWTLVILLLYPPNSCIKSPSGLGCSSRRFVGWGFSPVPEKATKHSKVKEIIKVMFKKCQWTRRNISFRNTNRRLFKIFAPKLNWMVYR